MSVLSFLGGSFGGGEVLVILLVVLVLFGAKNLPKIARNLGRSMEDFKKAARDVQHEIMHAGEDEPKPAAKTPEPETKPIAQDKAVPQDKTTTNEHGPEIER
ncbi:MAG TPA: twin-arginine translocase TatA/TatE family subunit [Kiritimatiellia bacterium]|jgi:sec-independent protein translocase protein TatA